MKSAIILALHHCHYIYFSYTWMYKILLLTKDGFQVRLLSIIRRKRINTETNSSLAHSFGILFTISKHGYCGIGALYTCFFRLYLEAILAFDHINVPSHAQLETFKAPSPTVILYNFFFFLKLHYKVKMFTNLIFGYLNVLSESKYCKYRLKTKGLKWIVKRHS